MGPRKQDDNIFYDLMSIDWTNIELVEDIIKDYERLNEKCDQVISKIKNRKQKKNKI